MHTRNLGNCKKLIHIFKVFVLVHRSCIRFNKAGKFFQVLNCFCSNKGDSNDLGFNGLI